MCDGMCTGVYTFYILRHRRSPTTRNAHGHTNHGQAYLDQTRAQPITYYYHGSGLHEAHEVMRQHRTERGYRWV